MDVMFKSLEEIFEVMKAFSRDGRYYSFEVKRSENCDAYFLYVSKEDTLQPNYRLLCKDELTKNT